MPPVLTKYNCDNFFRTNSEREKMPKRPRKTQKTQTNLEGYVVAAFAEDPEQAREYQALLKAENISVVVKHPESDEAEIKGIAVMVPEDCIDEAHVVIESQDAYDDFYDFVLEHEEDSEFDADLFEDDF